MHQLNMIDPIVSHNLGSFNFSHFSEFSQMAKFKRCEKIFFLIFYTSLFEFGQHSH